MLVYCLFGDLGYKCRSVVLDTAELFGMLYKSSGRWGSLVYHCVASKVCFMIIVRYSCQVFQGVGSKGQTIPFTESSHVAYQIKGN